MSARLRPVQRLVPAAAILLAILALWELIARLARVPTWLLPAPSQVARAFVESGPDLAPHFVRTLSETMLGYGAALLAGVVLAIAIDQSSLARRAIYPLLVTSQTVPVFALAPLLAIWFGFGMLPKVLIVALVCFFPIVVSLVGGLRSTDPEMLDMVRAMGAGRRQLFIKVRLPGALPALISGMKIAVTYSVIGAVIAEWVGASQGLGLYMLRASNSFQTDRVFAVIALIAALSIALFVTVDLLGRLIAPWSYLGEEPAT